MIPELGNFALALSAALALLLSIYPLLGAYKQDARMMAVSRPLTYGLFATTLLAFGCLVYAFIINDFSVVYVATNSNSQLPVYFRMAAVWGAHEGSLLLWVVLLSVWTTAVALFSRSMPLDAVARVLSVLGMINVGFLLFIILTSNPFLRTLPMFPIDGRDLNPLLQDVGLIFHPPLLYMGYVGFSVAFAFAISSLMIGRLDTAWARWSRPWTTSAWFFLTLGIALGSFWAYYELGWGGWWFWDPVENASFLPWLVSVALIHSLAVTEKRGLFRNWTIVLAITAFSLSLLGTFLVRSGVLTSVHAFATDPRRGVFILVFLIAVVGSSLTLFAMRASKVRAGGSFKLVSRETFLLLNNVLMTTAAATVLLGTLYPLIVDALNLGKLSVGPPYFNAVFVPIMVPVLLFMVVGTFARWKSDGIAELCKKLGATALISVALGCTLPILAGHWSAAVALGMSLALWIVLSSAQHIYRQLRDTARWRSTPWSFWGMHIAHIGVAVSTLGVVMVTNYETEKDVRMTVGDTVSVGGYTLRLTGIRQTQGPNYRADVGDVELIQDGKVLRHLHPEKRAYFSTTMPMTEAAIDTGLARDVYVSLGEQLEGGANSAWAVRVYYKPFVSWIWGGALLMALGGTLAALDRRYRKKKAATASDALVSGATA